MEIPERGASEDHLHTTAACDFFVVPTVTFRLLYCFLILSHERRQIIRFNVTPYPSAEWRVQQIVEAFPADGTAPTYLLRDRDSIYGDGFRRRVQRIGIEQVITARRSPWQNPYAERVIGSIRRECVDHVIVLGENHLRQILMSMPSGIGASERVKTPPTRPGWSIRQGQLCKLASAFG